MKDLSRSMPGTDQVDGRIKRGLRNRQRIVDAVYELVRSGVVQPTAEQIAKQAGVGERSVFRHFHDMEQLRVDMTARVSAEVFELAMPPPPDTGPLRERVEAVAKHRARIYEHIAPFRRATNLDAHRSPFLQKNMRNAALMMRADLQRIFAQELDGADDHLLDHIDLLTSFEAWDRLRVLQALGPRQAQRVVAESLARALGV